MPKKTKNGSDSGLYSDEHTKKVKEQLQLEGFALEIKAYEMLKNKGWETELGALFWDIERGLSAKERVDKYGNDLSSSTVEYREIDVIAEKSIVPLKLDIFTFAKIVLVIECKTRLGENWAIYVEKGDYSPITVANFGYQVLYDHSVLRYLRTEYPEEFPLDNDTRKILHGTSHHRLEISLEKGKHGRSLFKNPKSFYNALGKVIDAVDFKIIDERFSTEVDLCARTKKHTGLRYWRIYPVIVFDGPLWQVSYNDPDPQPVNWVKYDTMMHNQNYTVDIVRWDFFEEYLDAIEEELEELRKLT